MENGNRWRIARWGGAGLLLMTPLAMMQVSDEWHWGPASFLFLGTLMAGTLVLYERAASMSPGLAHRGGVIVALATSFLLVWANVAVGIIGGEDNPVNLSFFCLVLTAGVGSFATQFRPAGMARVMLGVAAVQVFLGGMIATAPSTAHQPGGPVSVILVSAFFTGLWLVSAALFHRAARQLSPKSTLS
ncbi:MAG: hypothetical protein V4530_03150 [Pseudomonadota bacterium]